MTPSPAFRLSPPRGASARPARLAIRIAYDGTGCRGWQVQPGARSIQGELERTLERLTGVHARVFGSGRTDSGVHAREQSAHFDLPFTPDPGKLQLGWNALLDPEIRVLSVRRARPGFHARFDAAAKEYRYFIWNAAILPPWTRLYRAHVRAPLDLGSMREAARRLVGRHDFAAFSANPRRETGGTVRTLHRLTVSKKGPEMTMAARGDGFLYRMARSLAGHLIRVGLGQVPAEGTDEILRSRRRTARVPTAPPQGLFLWKVYYGRKAADPGAKPGRTRPEPGRPLPE